MKLSGKERREKRNFRRFNRRMEPMARRALEAGYIGRIYDIPVYYSERFDGQRKPKSPYMRKSNRGPHRKVMWGKV